MLHRINGPMLHRLFSNLAFVASTHESNTIQRLRGTCKLVACANVKPTKCEHIYLMEIRRTIRLNTYTASSFVVVQIHQTSCCFIIFLRIDEFTWKHHAIIYVLKIRANNYIPLNILEEEERKKKKQHILKNRTNLRATAPLPFSLFTSDAIIARAFCEIAFWTCSGYWPSQRSRIYCMNVSGLPTFWPIKSKTEHKLLESTKHLPLRCESEAYLFQRLHRKCLLDRPTDWMLCNSIDCCGIDIGILLVPFSLPTQSPASKQRQKKTTSLKIEPGNSLSLPLTANIFELRVHIRRWSVVKCNKFWQISKWWSVDPVWSMRPTFCSAYVPRFLYQEMREHFVD